MTRSVVRLPVMLTLAGLASAAVPCAIVVHLIAEALAVGGPAINPSLFARHAYMLGPLLCAALWFGRTVGIGSPKREVIRRCALARAHLREIGTGGNLAVFALANFGIFCATQLAEGDPIASGSITIGLTAAALGSILTALVVFCWGSSLIATAVALVMAAPPNRQPALPRRRSISVATRSASTTFSLCAPSRPPPFLSFL